MKNERLRTWNATAAYALLQSVTWSFYAVLLSFSSNVLYDYGFTDSRISLLLGIVTTVSFLVQLLTAELVSRLPRLQVRHMLLFFGGVMLAASMLLLVPGVPTAAAVAAFGVLCMLLQMIPSFTNGLGMDTIKRGAPTHYSLARGLGSLAYSLLSFVTGFLVREYGTRTVPQLGAVLAALLILATLWYHLAAERNLRAPETEAKTEKKGGFLKQYPRFALFLLGAIFLCLSHNLMCNFMYQIMLTKNGGAGEQGIAAAISALVELPVMFLFPLMAKRLRCDLWVRASALCLALKPLIVLFSTTPGGVYLAQATQLLGYGLYTIGSVNYAEMVVGKGESVRAQSYLGSTVTVGALVALSTGGILCEVFSPQTMVLVSLLCALTGGTLIALTAQKTE